MVEDNEVNQAVASQSSPGLDIAPDLAGDGQQAVELVVQGHYGLVLMDCQLPLLDGYQATADIRRREGTARHTPIVAMTAGVLEDRQRCLAAGMDDHIAKPVLLAELQVVLSRWLEGEVTTAHAGGPAAAMGPTWEVLDPNRLAELGMLEATQNGTVLIDSLVERLLARIPIDLADLRTALDQGDATGVTRITHRLKGAAATVGSSGMVSLCEHLEVLARAGVIPPAANLVSRLEQEFNRVIRALEAVVPGRRSPGPPGE